MLKVILLSNILLNVILLNIILLGVVLKCCCECHSAEHPLGASHFAQYHSSADDFIS